MINPTNTAIRFVQVTNSRKDRLIVSRENTSILLISLTPASAQPHPAECQEPAVHDSSYSVLLGCCNQTRMLPSQYISI